MRNGSLNEDDLERKSMIAWLCGAAFYFMIFMWKKDETPLFVTTMNMCMVEDVTENVSTSSISPIAIACPLMVIATIILDVRLIKTLDTSVFGEDGEIHHALQEAIKIATRATAMSSIRFFMILAVLAVAQFLNASPEVVRYLNIVRTFWRRLAKLATP